MAIAKKKKDYTNAFIFLWCAVVVGAIVFGAVVELLKLAALVKWVFG